MIAALFVKTGGVYFGLDDVDPYDAARDAMTYRGPWPVVAHPPCPRWGRMAALVESLGGAKRRDDGGTFAFALECVRAYGGVLEHPAVSDAWRAFLLPAPPACGGWVRDIYGCWSCHVEQGHYGHRAPKPTWLYANPLGACLPSLKWGPSDAPMRVGLAKSKKALAASKFQRASESSRRCRSATCSSISLVGVPARWPHDRRPPLVLRPRAAPTRRCAINAAPR